MIKAGVIGLGKMGISHLSILNAHPNVKVLSVTDLSGFITGSLNKISDYELYSDYKKMFSELDLDCVVIATPTASHSQIVTDSLNNGLNVFVEKPLSLNISDGEKLFELAEKKKLINQVGYHNKFIGTFSKVKDLVDSNIIGDIYAIHGEAYGPVVLKTKGSTWRLKKNEGGGCLYDYASHVIDLMNYYIGVPIKVGGTIKKKVFSRDVEDVVYSTFIYESGIVGHITINWSEPAYRKMSTIITLKGTKGKIIVDRQDCKIYLTKDRKKLGLSSGYNILYTTQLTKPVWFYLRGEEYSSQIDYFVKCILGTETPGINSFKSALDTDRVISMINKEIL